MKFKFVANKYILPLIEKTKTLELACGEGELGRYLKSKKIPYTGLDLKKGPSVDMVHNLEKPLPLKDKSYNQVICVDSLEHIGNLTLLFKEVNRILKKKGDFLLTVPNTIFYRKNNHISAFTYSTLKNLFKNNKFKIEEEKYFYFVPYLKKDIQVFTPFIASHFVFKLRKE